MTTIGFIGLGHMGYLMAKRLVNAGHKVYVYDLVAAPVQSLVSEGAMASPSLKALAETVDIIFTSVQTGAQVEEICLGEEGLFAHARPHTLYIDCSSIEINISKKLHEAAKKSKIAMLDAPVSGGVAAAKAGTLTFMVGGESKDLERAQAFLKIMGQKIVHAGQAGSGQAAKICNNLLLGISMIGVCEAFALAEKLGLDAKKFYEISSHATGQCWSMTSYCPVPHIIADVPANHNYQPGFMAKMMLKDLKLGEKAADSVEASIPLGTLATELYASFVASGHGDQDFSAIIKMIANRFS